MQLPKFSLPVSGDGTISQADLHGRITVLFLYPKDDTKGCTTESIGFSAAKDDFAALNVQIFGLSKDSIKSHEKFIAKHDLTVPLISDEEGGLIEALGAWVEKSMYGKTYMGIERSTFVIDANGEIVKAWRKVRVPGHIDAVLDFVKTL